MVKFASVEDMINNTLEKVEHERYCFAAGYQTTGEQKIYALENWFHRTSYSARL